MSYRKAKSSSQSTNERGVVPARGKEQDKRNTATGAASPALTPAPPLALALTPTSAYCIHILICERVWEKGPYAQKLKLRYRLQK